jgi:hypothetical protein
LTKLEHALAHAARGFKVFPIAPGKKAPPLLNGWPQRASSDPDTVRSYWAAVPDANIGIHCDGMVVIDVDVKKGGDESLQKLEMIYGLPDTLVARTPSGGHHIFLRHSDGVSNTVEKLGMGLDVRSTNGYVLAAGSKSNAGDYVWESDLPVADAPEWLVLKLGTATAHVPTAKVDVPDAPAPVVDRALEWLAMQPGAVEGQGGDAHTYKVICGLRDLGVSAIQAFAVLQDGWNGRCSPPWDLDDLWTKTNSAYKYGQNAPGAKAVTAADFPVTQESAADERKSNVSAAMRLSEFASSTRKGPGYLIKGLLDRASYAMEYGSPGEGKTFVALDMAYHVAAGRNWMDRKVHPGVVLYLAYEGRGGLTKRAQALRRKYGDADVPLYIAGASYDLRSPSGRQALGQLMGELPEKPCLIVIDTFAHALMGGDENSAQDVGAFNIGVAALIEATGACVLILHHPTKTGNSARGSGALLGAIDTELEIVDHQVRSTKQREVELAQPIGFKLTPVTVGMDEDGAEMTSCVVDSAPVSSQPTTRLRGNNKLGFDMLCRMSPNNEPIGAKEWGDKCREFLSPSRFRQAKSAMLSALLNSGMVVMDDLERLTRRMT